MSSRRYHYPTGSTGSLCAVSNRIGNTAAGWAHNPAGKPDWKRFGRSGIRLLPQDTWSVLALFKHAHLPARRPLLCQLVAAPCPRHRHFSHCHPQRRTLGNWWRRSDLNAQLPACKAGTLPLSYVPMCVWRVIERPFSVCRGGTALGPPSAAFPRPFSFFVREPHRSHQPGATRPPSLGKPVRL